MEPLDHNEELQQHAPRLHALGKVDPFKVPEGYFEHLPHRITERASARAGQGRAFTFRERAGSFRPAKALWALPALAVVAAAAWWLARPPVQLHQPVEVPVLSEAEFEAYAPFADLDDLDLSSAEWDSIHVPLTEEEALAYIDQEEIDLHELLDYMQLQ